MKISILQENLNKGLATVSRSIATKATLPILANILLSTDKGQLRLSATNLETGINLWLGAKIEKEGAIAIPARFLTEFIASLPPEKIDLEVKETTLILFSGAFKASITGMAPGEFPQIPSGSKETILVFEKEELSKALSQVAFAAASDEGRPVLTGVLVRALDKQISLVATDGYRLSLKKLKVGEGKIKESLIIPAKTLVEVSRISQEVKDDEKEIKMSKAKGESQVVFSLPGVEIASRLIEGEFPDFEKIIPSTSEVQAVFDKEEFLRSVKIASIFAREQANIIKFKIGKEGVVISAESPQVGSNESQIGAKIEGKDLEIAFNFRFLLDFLNSVSGEEVIFEATGPLNPGVFKIAGDESFLHIIMPVRIQA